MASNCSNTKEISTGLQAKPQQCSIQQGLLQGLLSFLLQKSQQQQEKHQSTSGGRATIPDSQKPPLPFPLSFELQEPPSTKSPPPFVGFGTVLPAWSEQQALSKAVRAKDRGRHPRLAGSTVDTCVCSQRTLRISLDTAHNVIHMRIDSI
jgi:hypothetical protein